MADADASIDADIVAYEHVEDADNAQDGSASNVELITASANGANGTIYPDSTTMQFDPPSIPSQEDSSIPFSALGQVLHEKAVKRNGLAVIVPPAQNRWEYKVFQEDDKVDEILEEYDDAGCVEYLVLFSDGSEDVVSILFFTILPICQHMLPPLPPPSPSILMPDSRIITNILTHYSHLCSSTQSST